MFYAHFVLAKKGPLARIWLAAHWDKKLTKAHVYETNIESSVDGIMQPKVKMALRTSGHLLLGVVRIYSRKAKYLLADCNEAFVKIKMAFRPGMVDLPEDKREAAMNAITLPDVFHDFDTAMPDLDDVDIDSQFTLNQTRAEEITMREDYGNITLNDADDGFGDAGHMEMEPEMLRDGTVSHHDDFGSLGESNLEYEPPKQTEISLPPAKNSSTLDTPLNDDGFGGVGVQDFMSGGLFEGGSLFDDPVPGGNPSVRVPPSERTGFDDEDDFPGAPSPIHSDGSRPATPAESNMDDNMSLQGDNFQEPPPQLNETPAESPAPEVAAVPVPTPAKMPDTTTLLHNEDESFALAPVEASALKGQRRQRKRKLIVDEIKAITGEGMKAQLSDSSDIVTTLDIAPPTKRLMHWKETGGVDELFSLPGRKLFSRNIQVDYQNNLKITIIADEHFDTLPGGRYQDDLQLENVGAGLDDEESASPSKRGRKRKVAESPEKSAYLKRQEALAKQQEEFLAEEKRRKEETLRGGEANNSLQASMGQDGWASTSAAAAPGDQGFETMASPAYSGYGAPPSMGYPTPVHEPSYQQQPQQPFGTPVHETSYASGPPQQQTSFTEQWVNQVQSNPPSMMSPPPQEMMSPPQPQSSSIPPQDYNSPSKQSFQGNQAQDDWDDNHDNFETDNYGNDDYDDDDDDYNNGDAQVEGDEDMGEDETIEEFENRVLNKRAALLHRQLSKNFADNFRQITNRCNRKQVAQKFHSLLVLQKMMTLDLSQDVNIPYAEIQIAKGQAWDGNKL